MNIDSVLKMDSGTVVCVENGATITVKTTGEVKTFKPSFPKKSSALSAETFGDLYKHKHFEEPAAKAPAKAGDK